jgi:Ca2+-binding EF-hand superfamily protein
MERDLKFSIEESPNTARNLLCGIRSREQHAMNSLTSLASITLSPHSHDAKPPPPPPPAFTPEQLWLQEQLGKIPFFSRYAEQAKELREKKEAESAWKGPTGRQGANVAKETKAPAPAKVDNKRRPPPPRKKPKDLSAADEPIWNLFQELDVDGNGTIDEAEIIVGLEKMGLPSSPQAIVQLMGQFDTDGSGTISWGDFRTCVWRREDDIRAAFKSFDLDGNGEITGSELSKAMSQAGLPTTGKECSRMLKLLDKNSNSSVNYDEFRRFACLVPAIYKSESDNIRGWLATNAKKRAFSKRTLQKVETHNDTAGQFVFVAFDLALRASLAIALASAALYVANSD